MISPLLLAALIFVESGGNDMSIGDHGQAFGCLQIHREIVLDVNRITGCHYKHADAFDRDKAIKIATIYLTYYGEHIGHPPTLEDYARIWNGGPHGWRNPHTLNYWHRVQSALQNAP